MRNGGPFLSANNCLWYTGRMPEQYTRRPNTVCSICRKPIYRRPVEIEKNSGRVYCSMLCFGKSCRREVACLNCGKPILGGLNKKTCDRACANIHRTGIRYTAERSKDKVSSQRALKLRLLKQRGNACERCGYSKFEILQVHHKDRNRENNDVSNLELICPNCHFEEHYLEKSWLRRRSEK